MNTQTITVNGTQFTCPAPYSAGHVIDDAEAGAFNQLFAENLRNNFARRMKAIEEHNKENPQDQKPQLGQADFDAYAAEYKFGGAGARRVTVDPVEREARNLAEAAIRAALKANGTVLKTVTDEAMDRYIDDALRDYPQFMEQGKAVVAARASSAVKISFGPATQPA